LSDVLTGDVFAAHQSGVNKRSPGLPLAGRAFLSQFAGYSMVWGKIADLSRDEIQR
jgi:hypothetical protein